ncbi:hypothetical protein N9L45_00335 [Planctomycetota bacterium]|nr:hypothetical protein [Planctomycetota bacterium]
MNKLSGKFDVELAGKKWVCHLSMNAFRILCEKEYIKFAEMQNFLQEKPLSAVPKVIFYGILNNLFLTKQDVDKKLPDFEWFAAVLLDDPGSLEAYTEKIAIAFGGEAEDKEDSGNK